MKYKTLFMPIFGMSFVIALLAGCRAPATQSPTLAPSTSSPMVVVTLSPTPSAKPTMEKIWDINGSPNTFYRPTEVALNSQGNVYVTDNGNNRSQTFSLASASLWALDLALTEISLLPQRVLTLKCRTYRYRLQAPEERV
jgi:hypothetical protein